MVLARHVVGVGTAPLRSVFVTYLKELLNSLQKFFEVRMAIIRSIGVHDQRSLMISVLPSCD